MARFLIQAQTVITSSASLGVLSPGAVIVEDGLITDVGSPDQLAARGEISQTLGDVNRHLLIPGLINGHDHSLRPGRMRRTRSPLEIALLQARRRRLPALSPEEVFDNTLWGAVAFLTTGVTSVIDCYPAEASLDDFGLRAGLDAYLRSGIRVAACVRCSDQCNYTYEDDDAFIARLPDGLRQDTESRRRKFDGDRFFRVVDEISREYDGRDGRVRIGIGPTGIPWCSDELLRKIKGFAADRGAPVQIHLLESPYQAVAAAERYGTTAVEHLAQVGFLDPLTSCAHGIWLTADDRSRLADAGSAVIHNPSSNLWTTGGLARVPELLESGCHVGIGLDAAGFDPPFDIFRELRLAALLHRRPGFDNKQVSAPQLIAMATTNAAHALGMGVGLGQIQPGMAADLVLLDRSSMMDSPYADATDSAEDLLIELGSRSVVDKVLVGGRLVVDAGTPVGIDLPALRARVRESIERMLPLIDQADVEFHALEPFVADYYRGFDLAEMGFNISGFGLDESMPLRRQGASASAPIHPDN